MFNKNSLNEVWETPASVFYLLIFYFFGHAAACRILVPRPGMDAVPPVVEAQSLNHWTTREVPFQFFIYVCVY